MPELAIYFCPFYGPQPLHLFNPHVLSSHFPEALDTSGFPINFSPTHHGTPAFINLSEPVRREREAASTILGLILKQPMEGVNGRRRTLKERLGLKGFGCCGATWGVRQSTVDVRDDEDPSPSPSPSPSPPPPREEVIMGQASAEGNSDPMDCLLPASSGMNLAAALAAERQFREVNELANREGPIIGSMTAPGTPWRMSLMRLLNETEENKEEKVGAGNDTVCCVCMGRQKGAAFIPCGHTFCRVCSRELWLNRGSCPLCNQSILEILDIF